MRRKVEEGTGLCGEKLFKECFDFFCLKAYSSEDLSERDMLQIN
jgi:hypothetical protein